MKITRKQIRKIAFKLLTEAKTITGDPDLEKKLRKHVGGRQGLTGNPIFQMAKRGVEAAIFAAASLAQKAKHFIKICQEIPCLPYFNFVNGTSFYLF